MLVLGIFHARPQSWDSKKKKTIKDKTSVKRLKVLPSWDTSSKEQNV